ncbi:MAG: tetratricopeptide repeat protein [candidate division WS1 bacterium]|nr:tetratricopeptide repeat protein [candidate division WS1 bacterium]
MLCRECGVDIAEGVRFCPNCGEAVAVPAAPAAEESARAATPEDVDELVRRAVQADLRGNPDAAVVLAEDAVSADPANARARSLLAGLYERLGRTDEAVTQYEAALSLDPGNQLDRLRLKRLAPERAAALAVPRAPAAGASPSEADAVSADGAGVPEAEGTEEALEPRKRVRLLVAAAVVSCAVVVGIGLLGWKFILKPRIAPPETQLASAEHGPDVLMARARGAKLQGDYERARQLAYQVLAENPSNPQALAFLGDLSATTESAGAALGTGLADAVFPGEGSMTASGAALGLQAGLEAGAGLPLAPILAELPPATGMPPSIVSYGPQGGMVTSINPSQPQAVGTLAGLPTVDSGFGAGGGLPAVAPLDNMGALMGNVSGGMGNAGVTPLLPSGPSRNPGGTMRPGAFGSQPQQNVTSTVFPQQPMNQSPAVSGYPAQPGPSSVRPGSTGTVSGQPQGSVRVAQPQGGSGLSVNPSGGTVRQGASSVGAATGGIEDQAWRLQSEGTRLAQSGDRAGAIRALQAANDRWAESTAPTAAAARESISRQLQLLQEE